MLRNIKDIDVSNKRVIVRVDFNVPVENGEISDVSKILQSLETILYLIKQNAKVILISHFGRPGGTFNSNLSLKIVANKLAQLIPFVKIHFVDNYNDNETAINFAKPGEVIMLENLRFHPQEETCDVSFAQQLASLGDVFINDAFSVSHRKHASVYALARLLPSAAGFSLFSEVHTISDFLSSAVRPKTCIIGGAKVSTKLPLIRNILKKTDTLILGGGVAVSFAIVAYGLNVVDPFNSREYTNEIKDLIDIAQHDRKILYIPRDFCGLVNDQLTSFSVKTEQENALALDIGENSASEIADIISRSKTVLWNGPVGRFEDNRFANGTRTIAKSIAINTSKNIIKSIVGGGDTIAAINRFGYERNVSYCSTAGGAFLEYLEGKVLPGIEVLSDE